jgi:Spy/CpxP family protein refolding chaperone
MKRVAIWSLAVTLACGALVLADRASAAAAPAQAMGQQEGPPAGGPPPGFHLIPRFAETRLNLTDDQRKQIADLEKDVKDKLGKILTADQMKTLEEARPPRRGGPGGGGPGGNQPGGPSQP